MTSVDIVFPETSAIARAHADTHASKFMCAFILSMKS